MRYRRLHYRYAVVMAAERPRPLGDAWEVVRPGAMVAQPCWRPPADVFETADAVTILVDLAGVELDDLEVVLFEDALIVEGRRRLPPADAPCVYHLAEIRQGAFRLEVSLPSVIDPEQADAVYRQGLLQMIVKKPGGPRHDG
jgi:HSP20 family protein